MNGLVSNFLKGSVIVVLIFTLLASIKYAIIDYYDHAIR